MGIKKVNLSVGRVSAEAIATMLATDSLLSDRMRSRPGGALPVAERERGDVLPAGHPVSWAALWGRGHAPQFPGLRPIGSPEPLGGGSEG